MYVVYLAYPHAPILHNAINYVQFLSLPDFTQMTCTEWNLKGANVKRSAHSTFEISW